MTDAFKEEIQKWIDFIKNEDLPNISKEIKEAKERYERDKCWGHEDIGYLESVRDQWKETKRQQQTLERVLEIYDSSTSIIPKEESTKNGE